MVDLEKIEKIAYEAGQKILEYYKRDFQIQYKDDLSPVLEADLQSNQIICQRLLQEYSFPILSEENEEIAYEKRSQWEVYWCIDPLDGTKEFICKNGEFTVNVALIVDRTPVLGVVYAPALGLLYSAKKDQGARKNQKPLLLQSSHNDYTILTSRSHCSEYTQKYIEEIQTHKHKKIRQMGSSLKLCFVAEGIADCYPRMESTKEWDTAAGDVILRECKKGIYSYPQSLPLQYNKENLLNPSFVAK